MNNTEKERAYWSKRYKEERTGWDIGFPSLPLKTYIDQLENKDLKILIPGAGNAYEAEYLFCLLYTSPSPRDRTRSRMPSSA